MKLSHSLSTRALVGSAAALAAVGVLSLAGCGGGTPHNTDTTTVTVQGDVAIAYTKRVRTLGLSFNPTNGAPSAPGGDLIIREKASPSAPEHNITTLITQGKGDVNAPEVSYDGK